MMDALEHFRRRLRDLEGDPAMRKGRLVENLLGDPSIQWDAIYGVLHWKGRHRHKKRWRRTLIDKVLGRAFPRGGRRKEEGPVPTPVSVPRPAPPITVESDPPVDRIVPSPPSYTDAGAELSGEVSTVDIWNRFRAAFPILSLYRAVWNPHSPVARAAPPRSAEEWSGLWKGCAGVPLLRIARAADWPVDLDPVLPLVGPLAAQLWPRHPWDEWITADGAAVICHAAVPFLRRSACLVHGFQLGGCDPRGVWEAIGLPHRTAPSASSSDAVEG